MSDNEHTLTEKENNDEDNNNADSTSNDENDVLVFIH